MNFARLLELANAEHACAWYASVKRGEGETERMLALTPERVAADIRTWTETRAAAYLFATRHADSLSKAIVLVHDLLEEFDAGRRPYMELRKLLNAQRTYDLIEQPPSS